MFRDDKVSTVYKRCPDISKTRLKAPRSTQFSSLVFITLCTAIAGPWPAFAREAAAQQMTATTTRENNNKPDAVPFYEAVTKALKKRKTKIDGVCSPSDPVAKRILEEYGAVFVATKKVTPPPVCVFSNEEQVTKFQEAAGYDQEQIGFDEIELQSRGRAPKLRRQRPTLEFPLRPGTGLLAGTGAPHERAGNPPKESSSIPTDS